VNIAGSGKSHLEILPAFPSSVLGNTRDVVIYLPAGYLDDAAARYPVCYMHDGNNIFDPTANYGGWHVDTTCDGLIASGQMKKLIVVGAANTPDRMSEYTQVEDDLDPSCNGSQVTGGKAPQYADFMIQELKPVIDAGYRTLTGRDDTAVLGSSLGGLVSVWMAYANPSFARNVGGMSSTFDWGSWCLHNPTAIDDVRAAGKQDFLLYLDTGGSATTSIDNYGPTMDMENLVRSQGFVDGQDLMTYWDQNAPHNEQSWAGRVDRPLLFWFKK
jgi:predicted alpha/beta superfamily hydrolase